MLTSKFAHNLPDVGDLVMRRVALIQEIQIERAKSLEKAEMLMRAIAEEELELAQEVSKLWTKAEIKAAQASAY